MADTGSGPFQPWLDRWNLLADGYPIKTSSAELLPVKQYGSPAVLKLSGNPDQCRGAALMEWWDNSGAAKVLARDGPALLLERASGTNLLPDMARSGVQGDDQACRILCSVAGRLHRARTGPLPDLIPLDVWFRDLAPAADRHGGILTRCARMAHNLLNDPRQITVLHGDLHHDNVLDFGPKGWLAIDPHGLLGERGFDFANIFTNPDLIDPSCPVATLPERFTRRVGVVSGHTGLEPQRLLGWILAWTGLSAAWFLQDDDPLAEIDLTVARLAAAALDA